MTKPETTGLALGGGAALGSAHIGVLKALDEKSIKIDAIAGTSIGALVASLFAFGKDWGQIRDIAHDLDWFGISELKLTRMGLISGKRLADQLGEVLPDAKIQDADIPLSIIATDITNGECVILEEGDLSSAILASTALPGLFNPVERDSRLLVDGGIVENIPVKPLKGHVDRIISVNLGKHFDDRPPKNLIEVLFNAFDFAVQTASNLQAKEADVEITPDLSAFNMIDTDKVDELIEAGYEATKEAI